MMMIIEKLLRYILGLVALLAIRELSVEKILHRAAPKESLEKDDTPESWVELIAPSAGGKWIGRLECILI